MTQSNSTTHLVTAKSLKLIATFDSLRFSDDHFWIDDHRVVLSTINSIDRQRHKITVRLRDGRVIKGIPRSFRSSVVLSGWSPERGRWIHEVLDRVTSWRVVA